jgi:hypothetical protein
LDVIENYKTYKTTNDNCIKKIKTNKKQEREALKPDYLHLNPGSIICQLYDLGQVAYLFIFVSVSLSVKLG